MPGEKGPLKVTDIKLKETTEAKQPRIREVYYDWLTKGALKGNSDTDKRLIRAKEDIVKMIVDITFDSQSLVAADVEVKAAYLDTLRVLAQVSIVGLGGNLGEESQRMAQALELIKE